ncbi:MAG: mannosyltransferase family protein [Thermoleophilia bacterium]
MLKRLPEQLREAGLIFLITRGALFLMAPLAYLSLPKIDPISQDFPPLVDHRLSDAFTGIPHYLFDIWAKWDSVWFLQIAQYGYAADDNSTAFFPLYPLLIAVFKPLFFGHGVLAGIFISLACCLGAFYLFFLLVEIDFGRDVARRSVFYLAIFPTSLFFQTIYSESLFLLLTIGCLYAARRNEFILAGIAGALATLTRSPGLLLLVPLVIMYAQSRGWDWRPGSWDLRQVRWDAVGLLLVPLGLGVWMLYLGVRFGDPLLFTSSQGNWLREFIWPWQGGPLTGLWRGFREAWNGMGDILSTTDQLFWPVTDRDPRLWATYNIMNFIFTAGFIGLGVAAIKRLPSYYVAYIFAVLLLPLCTPSTYVPLFSMPRFVLTAFPAFILLALWGERNRWVDMLITVISLALLGFFTAKFVVWTWVS